MTAPSFPALAAFQDRLHQSLEFFLNGNFIVSGSRRADLLRPLRLADCRVPWDLLRPAVEALAPLETGLRSAPQPRRVELSSRGAQQGALAFAEAATLLADLHTCLEHLMPGATDGASQTVEMLRPYDDETYRSRGLGAVRALAACVRDTLKPYVAGFYLHGSLSTLDYTAYSDLDDFVVLKRETVVEAGTLAACAERLIEASRFLYEHDFLGHHRHFVATEIDLAWFPPAFLPPEVWRFATVLTGAPALQVRVRDSTHAHRALLRDTAKGFVRWETSNTRPNNMWHLKSLLSWVFMTPVLYLETQGTYCYKRFSFERARDAFGPAGDVLDLASDLRAEWRYQPTVRDRLLRRLVLRRLHNPVLFEWLMARWARPVPRAVAGRLERARFYARLADLGRTLMVLLDRPG